MLRLAAAARIPAGDIFAGRDPIPSRRCCASTSTSGKLGAVVSMRSPNTKRRARGNSFPCVVGGSTGSLAMGTTVTGAVPARLVVPEAGIISGD